ncbi:MAG TPA: YggT family protein [Pyrinomonadaceae bacterium]|nr:YggT family protein [Pyrinomonadaceae bacterium]
MLIIDRTFWFVYWLVIAIIVGVISLMIIRLIADAMDLNPFGWMSRTVRRVTDGIVVPVRGALRGFGVDPKYAPLVVILLVVLLGFFVLQLVGTIATTLAGILTSLERGAPVAVLGFILYGLLSLYILLIMIRIIFSWGGLGYTNRLMRFLINVTEPLLGPLRRVIPPLGMFDISPIVAFLLLWLFQAAVAGTLLRGATIQMF